MSERYRPVTNPGEYRGRLKEIHNQAKTLSTAVVGIELPIDTLTIFSQSDEEYNLVAEIIRGYGTVSKYSTESTLYVEPEDIHLRGLSGVNIIRYLGVRHPDDSRPELGYADYPVEDFLDFLAHVGNNPFLSVITSKRGQELIEFKHHDFNVRGYAVRAEEH